MITATLLMLIVVIPVFVLTAFIAWRYQEGNTKAKYTPDWDHNTILEFTWWALPLLIISILAVVAWRSSHELDPFKPVYAARSPITIQVVALDWKWLFIYPGQNIATVNYVQFPEKTPVNFQITSDAPMNSFWIPSLGGQIYAMSGMSTQLHLIADGVGSYNGVSANISGRGFAGMKFLAVSSTQADFDSWVGSVKQTRNYLGILQYNKLAAPSENNPASYYSSVDTGLYDHILMKFMMPNDELPPLGSHVAHYGARQ
jgi:cytochrome o ubiquinol oxidase subunit 2